MVSLKRNHSFLENRHQQQHLCHMQSEKKKVTGESVLSGRNLMTNVSTTLTSPPPPSVFGAAPLSLSARASGGGSLQGSWQPRQQSWCRWWLLNLTAGKQMQTINLFKFKKVQVQLWQNEKAAGRRTTQADKKLHNFHMTAYVLQFCGNAVL